MGILVSNTLNVKPDLEYMTTGEKVMFDGMMKAGTISFFRLGKCESCKCDIPKNKKYCSRECAQEGQDDE